MLNRRISTEHMLAVFTLAGLVTISGALVDLRQRAGDAVPFRSLAQQGDPVPPEAVEHFERALALLHARQYEYAIVALDNVIALAPKLPEAYVNMGFAYIGLEDLDSAGNAFEKALELRVDQANAYYGLAEVYAGRGELELALGAMRSFIHLSPSDDPYLKRARAALWEWEAGLGRVKGLDAEKGAANPNSPMMLRGTAPGHQK